MGPVLHCPAVICGTSDSLSSCHMGPVTHWSAVMWNQCLLHNPSSASCNMEPVTVTWSFIGQLSYVGPVIHWSAVICGTSDSLASHQYYMATDELEKAKLMHEKAVNEVGLQYQIGSCDIILGGGPRFDYHK